LELNQVTLSKHPLQIKEELLIPLIPAKENSGVIKRNKKKKEDAAEDENVEKFITSYYLFQMP